MREVWNTHLNQNIFFSSYVGILATNYISNIQRSEAKLAMVKNIADEITIWWTVHRETSSWFVAAISRSTKKRSAMIMMMINNISAVFTTLADTLDILLLISTIGLKSLGRTTTVVDLRVRKVQRVEKRNGGRNVR